MTVFKINASSRFEDGSKKTGGIFAQGRRNAFWRMKAMPELSADRLSMRRRLSRAGGCRPSGLARRSVLGKWIRRDGIKLCSYPSYLGPHAALLSSKEICGALCFWLKLESPTKHGFDRIQLVAR